MIDAGVEILAFIPSDVYRRGPIFEGLPTPESLRGVSLYTAYVDMKICPKMKGLM